MTQTEAYKIHVEQALAIAQSFNIAPADLALYAFGVNKIENRSFNPTAKNPNSTARGMMQMLEGTQKEVETKYLKTAFSPNKIFTPEYAVFLGQYELARQYKRYGGNWRKAIHAYNRGSYNDKNSKSKAFSSGERYANAVLNEVHKTDYAALNQAVGFSETAANTTGTTNSSYQEWT